MWCRHILHTTHKNHSALQEARREYPMPEFTDELHKYNKDRDMFSGNYEDKVSSTKYNDMPGTKTCLPMTRQEEINRRKEEEKARKEFLSERKKERVLSDKKTRRQAACQAACQAAAYSGDISRASSYLTAIL